ncbi:MAG: hypothetical protein IPL01_00415 [Acidobacteria bacterium]|nr:hypothetical protein [Acidobacteriota bacterium]MBK8312556.1 hypothetical protein [Acidobacteriota bacterium]
MIRRLSSLFIALGFVIAMVVTTSAVPFAMRIKADVPFDFYVGKKLFPKGDYIIESVNDAGTMVIRSAKKGKARNFTVIKSKMTDKPKSKLVFHRYGDQYFLARIWDGSSDTVLKLDKSSLEKKAAKDAKKENPDEVPVNDK